MQMQMKLRKSVAEQIKKHLSDFGIARIELAARMKCHPSFVTRLLGGKQNLSLDTIQKVASALQVSVAVEFKIKKINL